MRLDYSYLRRYVKISPGAFSSAFREFDPTDPNSIPPEDNKFGILLTALRARNLLKHRDREHIEQIVSEIDAAVNYFFHLECEDWILLNESTSRAEGEVWPPRFEDMDCSNPVNTSITEALLECTERFRDCGPFFTSERLFELFAVTALLHVDEALNRIRQRTEVAAYEAAFALQALEAINNAEWILLYERLKRKAERLGMDSKAQTETIDHLSSERHRLRQEYEQMQAAKIIQFKSLSGKNAVSARLDQRLKPGWIDHCRKAVASGIKRGQLEDLLNIVGYDPMITKISRQTLRNWAKEAGFKFIAGRRKPTNHDVFD